MKKNLSLLCLCLMVFGCKTIPDSATVISQPQTPIAKTLTNFSQAKACMDQLLLEGGRQSIPITVDLVDDATGSVKVSTSDMIIKALSDMSLKSRAFKVLVTPESFNRKSTYVSVAAERYGIVHEDAIPFYIRGAISQADNAIASDNKSASLTMSNLSIGASDSQTLGTISLDLQVANLVEQTIIHGTAVSNTITVLKSGDQATGRGLLNSSNFGAGLSVSLSSNIREGKSQAVRNLIDFSVIEVVGRFTGVPYWRCFQLDSTHPMHMKAAREIYDSAERKKQISLVQDGLWRAGEYQGRRDGDLSKAFVSAVTAGQAKRNLIPNGRVGFQLFNALVAEGHIEIANHKAVQDEKFASLNEKNFSTTDETDRIGLNVALLNAYPTIGENVYVRVSTNEDAQLFCYYEYFVDNQPVTARIFPNRYNQDNYIQAGESMTIPSPEAPFALELQTSYLHKIGCVATRKEYTPRNKPSVASQADLAPLRCDYSGVDCAFREHQLVDTLETSVKLVDFQARN